MTPTAETGAPAGGSGYDFDSSIDSAFSDQPDTGAETTEEPVAPEPEPEPEPLTEEETEPAELPDDEEQDIDPESLDQNRNHYRVPPNRMKAFVQAKNFMKAIEEYAPTVEAVKDLHQNASDFRAMQIEFQSGQPEAVSKFLDFWGSAPEGLAALSHKLPEYLATNNPAALQQLEGRVHQATVTRAYDRAARVAAGGDSKAAAAELYKAQSLEYALTGKFRYNSAAEIPRVDPAKTQESALQQREQALARQQDQFITNQWSGFDKQNLSGAKESSLQQEIDKAFAPVKDSYQPGVLAALKREASAKVQEALKGSFEWDRNHNLEVAGLKREFYNSIRSGKATNAEPQAQALVNDYRSRAARVLPSIVRPLINGATQKVVAQNQATHQKLAAGAAKSAPGGSGRPAPRSITPMQPRQSVSDRLDELLK